MNPGHLANGHLPNGHLAHGQLANGQLANGNLAIICWGRGGGIFANIQKFRLCLCEVSH